MFRPGYVGPSAGRLWKSLARILPIVAQTPARRRSFQDLILSQESTARPCVLKVLVVVGPPREQRWLGLVGPQRGPTRHDPFRGLQPRYPHRPHPLPRQLCRRISPTSRKTKGPRCSPQLTLRGRSREPARRQRRQETDDDGHGTPCSEPADWKVIVVKSQRFVVD